jgi:ketosteroid isomerase-like protein
MILLVVCSLVDLSSQTPTPANQTRDADEILRFTREWGDAVARRDAPALNRLLADDFTFVSPRGRLLKKPAYITNRTNGSLALEPPRLEDVSVRVYGAAAVVTSRYTAKGEGVTGPSGSVDDVSGEYTRTDTWIKVNGRWQVVANHLSPIVYSGAREALSSTALVGLNGDELKWSDSSPFPGAHVAVLYGASYTGGYTIRMRRPDGHVEKPHYHESDEHVSVLSGIMHVGVGDGSNRAIVRTFREGGYVVIPARTLHYSRAEGDVVEDAYWSGPAAALYPGGPR